MFDSPKAKKAESPDTKASEAGNTHVASGDAASDLVLKPAKKCGSKLVIPHHDEIAKAIGIPFENWHHQCHGISLAIMKSGILGVPCRVSRGFVKGVGSQHSWITIGMDCYDQKATIVDPTLWSYREDVTGIYVGSAKKLGHQPHGAGSIWAYGRPADPMGPIIPVPNGLSEHAKNFLEMASPIGLDLNGWAFLAHAPMEGWPSKEIITAMYHMPEVSVLIPVDIVGMVTDLNPGGLYLPDSVKD